jgi:hypothetical protein
MRVTQVLYCPRRGYQQRCSLPAPPRRWLYHEYDLRTCNDSGHAAPRAAPAMASRLRSILSPIKPPPPPLRLKDASREGQRPRTTLLTPPPTVGLNRAFTESDTSPDALLVSIASLTKTWRLTTVTVLVEGICAGERGL